MAGHQIDRSRPVDWDAAPPCPFATPDQINALPCREAPYWHALAKCRHIGIYKPNARVATWIARFLRRDARYVQRRIGSALLGSHGSITHEEALRTAISWFKSGEIEQVAKGTRPLGRTTTLRFCPYGVIYTVGSALTDYMEWSRLARSPGGHYNNLVLINHYVVGPLIDVPLEEFSARHLKEIAVRILETRPHPGFSSPVDERPYLPLTGDELRRRKKVFNSVVSILRVAFQHAWDTGHVSSDRPWRCLKRISVPPAPRTLFLSRQECRRLLESCSPALARLVLAALYSGCRIGELGNLRVKDVGREVYGLHIAAFKRSPARFVFLPDEGMAFFLDCCDGKAPDDFLLRSEMGMVWHRQHISAFHRAASRAGLPSAFVFHGLRHTYASDLVRQGVPLSVVARQLGHTDTRTVSATYGHLAEGFREDQVRTRFSPLSDEFQSQAAFRQGELDRLWESVHSRGWREYGSGLEPNVHPMRSYARTDRSVLEAFAERGAAT